MRNGSLPPPPGRRLVVSRWQHFQKDTQKPKPVVPEPSVRRSGYRRSPAKPSRPEPAKEQGAKVSGRQSSFPLQPTAVTRFDRELGTAQLGSALPQTSLSNR